jgi:NAD(P)-dependent dehydrogenase (short-subunit alcohol dehydrogenase family)
MSTSARHFDASNEEDMRRVVDEALEKYGRLDIMFANGDCGTAKDLHRDRR